MVDACCSCEEVRTMLDEFLEEVKLLSKSSGKAKTKRAPSAYNLYMKSCLERKKGDSGEHKEKFKTCAFEYKQQKGA